MSASQQGVLELNSGSQRLLEETYGLVGTAGLSNVLESLPSFDDYDITVTSGSPGLNIGCVWPDTVAGDCTLYSDPFPRTIPNYSKNHAPPRYDWVCDMSHEERTKKGVFAWSQELYEGLFQKGMDHRSAALLKYYFLQFTATTPETVNIYQDVDVDALCEALELLKNTEEFQARAREIHEQPTAAAPSASGPMDIDGIGGSQENKNIIQDILDDIKRNIPAVDLLPPLSEMNLVFEPHDKTEYLPLRLYIGHSKQDPASKVWMYMKMTNKNLSQPCEVINAKDEGVTKVLRTGGYRDLDEVELVAMLKPGLHTVTHSSGHNYRQATYLTRYYFLLRYLADGSVTLQRSDFRINDTFHRYFESGIRKFCQYSDIKRDAKIFKFHRKEKDTGSTAEDSNTQAARKPPRVKRITYKLNIDSDDDDNDTSPAFRQRSLPAPPPKNAEHPSNTNPTSTKPPHPFYPHTTTINRTSITPQTTPASQQPPRPRPRTATPYTSANTTSTSQARPLNTHNPKDLAKLASDLEQDLGEAILRDIEPRRREWNHAQESADVAFAEYQDCVAAAQQAAEAYNEAMDVQQGRMERLREVRGWISEVRRGGG